MSDSHSIYDRNGKEVRDSYSMLLLCRAFMAREDGEKEKCLSYLQLAEEEAGRGLLRYVKGETKEKYFPVLKK